MFKKTLKVGGQSQLSGKDKKTLKATLMKQFDQDCIDHLLANTDKIVSEKLSGSKMVIYMDEDSPLFVDATGKNEFFPSLYTLNAYPQIIPSVQVFEGVQDNLYKGANLMWPGVSDYSDLNDFEKDQVVGVRSAKGQFVAVGALFVSKKQLNQEARSGVCLQILTVLNDKLWEHGSKTTPQVVLGRPKQKVEEKSQAPNTKESSKKQEQPEQKLADKKSNKEKGKPTVEKETKKSQGKKSDNLKKKDQKSQSDQEQPEVTHKRTQQNNKKKAKGKGKKQKSDDQVDAPLPSKVQQTKDSKQKPKPQKHSDSDSEPQPVPKSKVQASKTQPKAEQKDAEESEQDLASLIHQKKGNQPVKKVEVKKENVFSDDDDDNKKKKKHPKKAAQPVKKQEPKKQKQQASEDKSQSQQDFRKGKKKDNKKKDKKEKEKDTKKQQQEDKDKKDKRKKREESDEDDNQEDSVPAKIKPQLMDEYFKEALLNCIKLGLKDEDLPIDSGQLFTDYIQLARREGVHLDIKASSYGKMNKFYETMMKEGLIEFKQGKSKHGTTGATISKVSRDHQELEDYVPTVKKMGKREVEQDKLEKQDHNLKFQVSKTLEVEQVYRPKYLVEQVLGVKLQFEERKQKKEKKEKKQQKSDQEETEKKEEKQHQDDKKDKRKVVMNKDDFFTWEECKEKISAYLEKVQVEDDKKNKKKDKKDKVEKTIYLNYQDNDFLKELLKDEIEEHEEQIKSSLEQPLDKAEEDVDQETQVQDKKKKKHTNKKYQLKIERAVFQKQVQKNLEPFHRLVDKPNGTLEFKEGEFKGVQIIAEKANNKNVTRINGLELIIIPKNKLDQQITNLTSILQQKLASSVSVHNLPGKNAGKEITIQGTFLDELVEFFVDEHGVNKDLIVPVNKLDKKKKN